MPKGYGRPSTKPVRHLRTAVETAEEVVGKKDPRLREQRNFMVSKGDKALERRQQRGEIEDLTARSGGLAGGKPLPLGYNTEKDKGKDKDKDKDKVKGFKKGGMVQNRDYCK